MRFLTFSSLIYLLTAGLVQAHEFWISPEKYVLQNSEKLQASLRVGQEFSGPSYPYRESQFERFEIFHGGSAERVAGRVGDRPALQQDMKKDGLQVIVHQTSVSRLTYTKFEKFEKFARDKNFPTAIAEHEKRGISKKRFVETYQRFAKSLVAVGDGKGSDSIVGMQTEIVLLDNPYRLNADSVRARVLQNGEPRKNAQVEIFERAPGQDVTITKTKTDDEGVAIIPVKPGHEYLLDAVALVALPNDDPDEGAVWKSLWAASTFFVPEKPLR